MSPGQAIAHYRIVSKLGKGGMGEVWRAMDIKLNREVAIKVLPAEFTCDPERMARFTREAQVLASLNHPNIAAVHGVEEHALVMELIEGEELPRGLPLEATMNYARQIADALEYAHERGIVHRDLKPANIKVTPDGRVKVLDFGLAKAVSRDAAPGDPESSPTLTLGATIAGVMLGTPAYMAPEQARGQLVDRRADIWAFGVVLYEMLTGRRLFSGETVSDTLASVLKGAIDLEALRPEVRPVVERCLRRDPKLRWRSIGDVFLALEEGVGEAVPVRQRATPWMGTAVVLAIVAGVAGIGWWSAARPIDQPLTRLDLDLGPNAMFGLNTTVAISPNGRRMVFPVHGPDGREILATRLLDQAQPTLLPGTEDGHDAFFSPDGQWIGFFASSQIEKISVQGGAPVAVGSFGGSPMGASWGSNGDIIAALGALVPLSRIPGAAGQPQPLAKVGPGEATQRWPQVLPGGHAILFTASNSPTSQENADIQALSLESGKTKIVQRGGYYGRYLPSGHLVYVHRGVLFGVRFDVDRLEVRGAPTPLLEDVAANPATGGAQFDFSRGPTGHGTFVYVSGKSAAQAWQVAWLDSSGKARNVLATPGVYAIPRLSSDGRKLAFGGVGPDIYVTDLDRETTTRLTFTGHAAAPVWAPDGKHVVFQSSEKGFRISWVRADGGGEPQRLLEQQNVVTPWCFSPDGKWLAYFARGPETGFDIWTLPLDLTDPNHPKTGKPQLFLRTPADEYLPRFSPDGRWIAYRSDESGNFEIYVRPFSAGAPPGSGGKLQISSGGGLYGIWANNGHELFYETADDRIMVVDYMVNGDSFVAGKPRVWSDKHLFYAGSSNLDLAPDSKRFIVLSLPENAAGENSVHVVMLENFLDYVKRKIPVK